MSPPTISIAWNTGEWAAAIASLPIVGPLPVRTVLVPNGRVAHSLRRELVRTRRVTALAGTLFRPVHLAAQDVLHAAGLSFSAGEEALRPARLASLFREVPALEYFETGLLREARGWEHAFARTISDLEAAGLRPADLTGALGDDPRWRDVATVWRHLDELAGPSWTTSRIVLEAAERLEAAPELWPHDGPSLAPASGDASPVVARFLCAIPGMHLLLLAARPARSRYLERFERLFGGGARAVLEGASAPRRDSTEKEILSSYLFEPGEVIADPGRPRSSGPDGSVALEEHAGIDEEIDAAIQWVAREVLERGTPLEEIAVLTPARGHVVDLVATRLLEISGNADDGIPVFVAGGRPLVGFAAGARALAVVRALRRYLPAEDLVSVLPSLRSSGPDEEPSRHLTHARAVGLAYGLGTVGGSSANPRGALDWTARLDARRATLEKLLRTEAEAPAEDPDREDRDRTTAAESLAAILSITPAMTALAATSRLVVEGAALDAVWAALHSFLGEWVLPSGGRFDVVQRMDEAIAPLCADERCASLSGEDAVGAIEDALLAVRVARGRYGDPAVYVGTVDGALGLRFAAVRVIGLHEGALPSQPHEDPVLPDALRAADPRISRAEDRLLAQLHALDRIVRDAGRVVLSAPRVEATRSEREPSSVLIEAAAALGRPNATTRKRSDDRPIPDTTALRRDFFARARADAEAFRSTCPLTPGDWQLRVADHGTPIPSAWLAGGALDLSRMRDLRRPDAPSGPLDGLLGAEAAVLALLPGLSAEHPTSASALKTLLECPHRFLLERVLRFVAAASPPAAGEIDALAYGSLFHGVAEELFRLHGTEIGARARDLPHWKRLTREAAEHRLDALLETYPLAGSSVREQQLARLTRDLDCFLDYEWGAAARSFAGVELAFGYPDAVGIDLDGGPLFVRGTIDRIDVEDGRALVRDLKTGKAHPRIGKKAGPDHVRDLQLAVYAMVLRRIAGSLGLPDRVVAAYVHTDPHQPERAFRDDFDALETEARGWLSAARRLLAAGTFPRTIAESDCTYCPYRPVCGPDPYPRATRVLETTAEITGPFHRLKGGAIGASADTAESGEEAEG